MNTITLPLIFVFIGNKFPDYGYESLNFSSIHSRLQIILLTDSVIDLKKIINSEIKINNLDFYNAPSKLDNHLLSLKSIREGFWTKTLERFHVLQQYCSMNNITKFFHSELDNVVFNLNVLSQKIEATNLEGVFLPRQSISTMIGSLVYCNSLKVLQQFNDFSLTDENMSLNEMEILSSFQNRYDSFFTLPSTPSSKKLMFDFDITCNQIGGIVDGNLYGRYIFGRDPRNVNGSVYNMFQHSRGGVIDWEQIKFGYNYFNNKYSVFTLEAEEKIYFYNLHIHSKSINSSFKKIGKIIYRLNNNSKTLILINPLGYVRFMLRPYFKLKIFLASKSS